MNDNLSKSIAHVDSLDSLEQHEHLHLAHSSVEVGVALHLCIPYRLIVIWRTDAHHQAEIPIGEEKLLSFELA